MPDTGTISQETRERIQQIGGADVVIGLLTPPRTSEQIDATVERVRESVAILGRQSRALVVHPGGIDSEHAMNTPPDVAPGIAAPPAEQSNGDLRVLRYPPVAHNPSD